MAVSGRCPNCDGDFAEVERAGVRVDACRNCRGIWLDRGELEQLVERERKVVAGADHDEEDFVREITGRGRGERHRDHDDDDRDEHRGRDHDEHRDQGHGHGQQRYGLDAKTASRLFEDYSSHKKKRGGRKGLLGELLG